MENTRYRVSAKVFAPNNNSSGTFFEVTANPNREDDELDASENDERLDRARASYYYTILCVKEHNLIIQSILEAAPPGKLNFLSGAAALVAIIVNQTPATVRGRGGGGVRVGVKRKREDQRKGKNKRGREERDTDGREKL